MSLFRLGLFALGLWLWCLALPAAATPTLEQEQEIRATFVTPHTAWAKPYAGGTTRVLFFSDYRNTQAREIVELMQRFDIQADAAYYSRLVDSTRMQWHGSAEGVARIRRLLDSGAHDVFLFNGISPDVLPAELKKDLLARVAQGKGLVLVGVKQRGRLDPPLENDPDRVALDEPLILDAPLARQVERGDPEAELFALKQGRAARLPAAPVADYSFGWEIPYDHWQERLGRTVLWAAGKLPAQPLRLRREPGTDTGIAAKSPPDARLVVTLPAGTPIAQVRIRERRADGLIIRDSKLSPLPPAGEGSGERAESTPRPMGEGSGVRAITGPAAAGLPAGSYFDEVIATDAAGRVVAWATLPFVVASPQRVELELSRTWGEIGDAVAGRVSVVGRALEHGLVSVELRDRQGRMLAATPPIASKQGMAPFSDLVAQYAPARQHGVFAYSLGDETVTRGSDASPSDLAAYRRYLQGVYGDIAALNDSWGTDYAGFEVIALLDPSDPTEEGAKRAGNYARWYDRQAWESANFLGLCRRFGEAFRRLDPRALTGFEGAGRLERADDIEGIVRTNGFWTPYPGSVDAVVRGIAPRDFPYANWMGYTKDTDSLTWSYWRMVLNGGHGVWWWRWDNIGRFMGLLRPDLSPPDEVAEMLEDTRIAREGLGDLLLRSEMQAGGIALLYSQPSLFAAQVAEGSGYGKAAEDHAAWQRTLLNLGLSFRYLTDAMLRRGELDPKTTRVLILPRVEALGDEEARRIAAFVEAGGTVIADVRPGRFTGRVKPRAAGVLDALFGVDSRGSTGAIKKATVEIRLSEGQPAWRFEGMTVGSGIVADAGNARFGCDCWPAGPRFWLCCRMPRRSCGRRCRPKRCGLARRRNCG